MSGPTSASRRSAVPPFAVMTVLQRVAEARAAGREVISLCAGEPSQGAPSDVRRRLAELMIDRTPLGYSETFGLTSLRQAIAGHYRRWYDLDVPVAQIAVTTGSSGAFLVSFLAAFDAGDRVLLARPGYPAYRNILSSLGCEVVELPCGPAERFQPTRELLDAALRDGPVAGLVLASPANPTGTMVDHDQLADLAGWCRDHGVRLISDEIYHGIVDASRAERVGVGCCAWQHDRSAVIISSFSKYAGHDRVAARLGVGARRPRRGRRCPGRQLRAVRAGTRAARGDRGLHRELVRRGRDRRPGVRGGALAGARRGR